MGVGNCPQTTMNKNRAILKEWLDRNPDGYLLPFKDIEKETGVHRETARRHLPDMVAERDGILPSDVIKKRGELHKRGRKSPDKDTLTELRRLYDQGLPTRDIAYILDLHPHTVNKYIRENNAQ